MIAALRLCPMIETSAVCFCAMGSELICPPLALIESCSLVSGSLSSLTMSISRHCLSCRPVAMLRSAPGTFGSFQTIRGTLSNLGRQRARWHILLVQSAVRPRESCQAHRRTKWSWKFARKSRLPFILPHKSLITFTMSRSTMNTALKRLMTEVRSSLSHTRRLWACLDQMLKQNTPGSAEPILTVHTRLTLA